MRRAPLVLLLLAACGEQPRPPAPPRAGTIEGPCGIVLVTVDTLRRDVLGCYGYPRPTSPRIDAFASEGVLFERAVAPMATTLPSHLSMLTGLWPHQHGIFSNRSAATRPFVPGPDRESLAQLLAEAGWRTAAFVSAPPVVPGTGIGAGFQVFDEPPHESPDGSQIESLTRTAERTMERAVAWIAEEAQPPFFLWVHLWDTHEPNAPDARHLAAVRAGPPAADVRARRGIVPERLPAVFAEPRLAMMFFDRDAKKVVRRSERGERAIDERLIDDLIDRYDADVRACDEAFGALLDALEAKGLARRTVVAFTADHGQSLGEGDWLGHGRISATNVLVPLVVRFPPGVAPQPARVPETVSLVDLMPTVMARVGGEPARRFLAQAAGEDVLSGSFGREWALVERTTSTLKATPPGPEQALVGARFKLARRAGEAARLYDLASDPQERADVAAEHPELVAGLVRELERRLAERPAAAAGAAPAAAGAEARRQLKALEELGYAGDDEDDASHE